MHWELKLPELYKLDSTLEKPYGEIGKAFFVNEWSYTKYIFNIDRLCQL